MDTRVVLPRDSWTALALALAATRADRVTDDYLARYVCTVPVAQKDVVCISGRVGDDERDVEGVAATSLLRKLQVPLRLGKEPFGGAVVYIAMPTLGRLFYDGTRRWADYAQWEMVRWYTAWCRIATVQTVGGGWASLRRADKALECAMELYDLASIVGDGEVASKCRVFVGWAHLWSGKRDMAVHLFTLELKDAVMRGDIEHERRCQHAIINATTNPTLNGEQGDAESFCLTDCWTKAFAGVDVVSRPLVTE